LGTFFPLRSTSFGGLHSELPLFFYNSFSPVYLHELKAALLDLDVHNRSASPSASPCLAGWRGSLSSPPITPPPKNFSYLIFSISRWLLPRIHTASRICSRPGFFFSGASSDPCKFHARPKASKRSSLPHYFAFVPYFLVRHLQISHCRINLFSGGHWCFKIGCSWVGAANSDEVTRNTQLLISFAPCSASDCHRGRPCFWLRMGRNGAFPWLFSLVFSPESTLRPDFPFPKTRHCLLCPPS